MRRIRKAPANQQAGSRWLQAVPPGPRQRRPEEDSSKVIVSELLSLGGPGQPGEVERRTDQTDSSTAAGPLPSFDDAGGALEGATDAGRGEVR
jgi:hypothetical protein